jgi:fucose permease
MPRRNLFFLVLASGFVLLGMSITVPGVTWPSVAESFDRSLADLGYVTLLFGGGYTVSSFASGRLTSRMGIAPALGAAGIVAIVALTALATSGTWAVFLFATAMLGAGGGLTDSVTNTYVALRRGTRSMGLIHGIFGVGAIAGPLLVTALLQAGLSWRVAYAVLAVGQAMYVAGVWWSARDLDDRADSDRGSHWRTLWRSSVVVWSLILFFVYAGIGAGAGVWAFTYLTDERGMSDGLSGLIVAAYWAALTASRLLLGVLGDRVRPNSAMRWAVVSTVIAFTVLWLADATWLAASALVFAGFSHGPIFPIQMLLTPRRVGPAQTARVIGFEIAAANVGGALLPGLMGVAVAVVGLSAIPPLLVVNALTLLIVAEILRRKTNTSVLSAQSSEAGT